MQIRKAKRILIYIFINLFFKHLLKKKKNKKKKKKKKKKKTTPYSQGMAKQPPIAMVVVQPPSVN
jgi:hypothetical protein